MDDEYPVKQALMIEVCCAHCECQQEAADKQYRRLGSAKKHIKPATRHHKDLAVREAIDRIPEKESSEKKHFGRQENPHAEFRRLALLFDVIELLRYE